MMICICGGRVKMMKKDRKGSLLVSSLCGFISADAVNDVEHWKSTQFGVGVWKL